jgi:hypothetical protein
VAIKWKLGKHKKHKTEFRQVACLLFLFFTWSSYFFFKYPYPELHVSLIPILFFLLSKNFFANWNPKSFYCLQKGCCNNDRCDKLPTLNQFNHRLNSYISALHIHLSLSHSNIDHHDPPSKDKIATNLVIDPISFYLWFMNGGRPLQNRMGNRRIVGFVGWEQGNRTRVNIKLLQVAFCKG